MSIPWSQEEEEVDPLTVAYLEKHDLLFYFEDVTHHLLKSRELNPNADANKYFEKYFSRVGSGTHVLRRDYAYISANPHNRRSFVRLVRKSCQGLLDFEQEEDGANAASSVTLQEFHALLQLLCPDFPADFLYNMSRVPPEQALDEILLQPLATFYELVSKLAKNESVSAAIEGTDGMLDPEAETATAPVLCPSLEQDSKM